MSPRSADSRSIQSKVSKFSKSSRQSSIGSAAIKARAKAEAARAQLSFAEQEADVMKKKADLEANLHVLKSQKAVAVALAEAAAYEEAIESGDLVDEPQVPEQPLSPAERTSDYVQRLSHVSLEDLPTRVKSSEYFSKVEYAEMPKTQLQPTGNQFTTKVDCTLKTPTDQLNYQTWPQYSVKTEKEPPEQDHETKYDLARHLIRKEIVSSSLLKFDDHPENYWSWKASFKSATKDLNLSAQEELDLMTKWLGPESSVQAKRIRSVNILHPETGLCMLWQRLEESYGAPEVVEHALLKKLEDFPRLGNKDSHKLRELGDILLELECAKTEGYLSGLAYLDTARGLKPIVEKLPYSLQEKWVTEGFKYKEQYKVPFPPFIIFSRFVRQQAKIRNDPSFFFPTPTSQFSKTERVVRQKVPLQVYKTDVPTDFTAQQTCTAVKNTESPERQCPIHKKPHPLKKCRSFRNKSLDDRKTFLKENRICFRCCGSTQHVAKDCKTTLKCLECKSEKHISAMHPGPPPTPAVVAAEKEDDKNLNEDMDLSVTSKCTEICGKINTHSPRSCSKICLVKVFPAGRREKAVTMYAVLDEQSNRSLAKTEFFNIFDIKTNSSPYTLKTCSGMTETSGRRASNFIIEPINGKLQIQLPTLIECDMIPDDRSEIPSPVVAQHHPHLQPVANKIPAVDPNAPILLLLGRDILRVHKIREQINGPHNTPFAQRLDLGWVIVGEVCLGTVHKPPVVSVFKANVLLNGRPSICSPCPNNIQVKENFNSTLLHQGLHALSYSEDIGLSVITDSIGSSVFQGSKNDDKPTLSVDDRQFLHIMQQSVYQDEENSLVAPLPFRSTRRCLPSNKEQAKKRFCSLQKTLEKKPDMKRHFTEFMQKMLDNGHAEVAPPLKEGKEHWYLPTFGVYHPQKPGQIRVVFDSSAEYDGVSLNNVLLRGPDLNNTLLGVLLRFRREPIAFSADVQQMFYCFVVQEEHRDYLRFLWYEDNDTEKNVIDYRMKVHVFGNSPSPAVAIYCMRKAAQEGEKEHGTDAKRLVEKQFYVDDCLSSVTTAEDAIDILTRTREMLAEYNLLLHKIASNDKQVVNAFPVEDRAVSIKDLDLSTETLPVQRSLGLSWNLETDSFTFQVSHDEKPYTRRGVLSMVNSIYDPLGFVAPITIKGKAIVRELTLEQHEWDAPLPSQKQAEWNKWKESLDAIEHVKIKRCYIPVSLTTTKRKELWIFSDASTTAIGAVAYLRAIDQEEQCHFGFIMGKSKLAPRPAHTVPRLELCAAVLAVELYDLLKDEMDILWDAVNFFTDSKIVLGYIHNTSRRFYVYVSNRVSRIRKSTHPDQWFYISTEKNPADHATRPVPAILLPHTNWLSGPSFLSHIQTEEFSEKTSFSLVNPETDDEIRPEVATFITKSQTQLGCHRFERFSSWQILTRTMAKLIHVANSFQEPHQPGDKRWIHYIEPCSVTELVKAKDLIIGSVQHEVFKEEYKCIEKGQPISKQSSLKKLCPIVDIQGLLRVGGRISCADVSWEEKHPLILPRTHHISTLIVRYYHEQVAHQGRHITEGAIRAAGFWIVGSKRVVSAVIHKCVVCRKLRGSLQCQKMSDLPVDRLAQEPPFTNVGLDVFGPWTIVTRRTRGGSSENKRWAVIFTCMSTRAVHIELIESMTTSSFINALRRFFSVRGPARLLRSDRGTNFVGACKELNMNTDDPSLQNYLKEKGCTWLFNPPHSSHMGGSWERLIGVSRRILDAMLLKTGSNQLTHEVLSTLMAEVMAIMNARPLLPVSTDPENPTVLSPTVLLTQKTSALSAPSGNFDTSSLYGKQWKQVQCLADTFWKRWRGEYLSSLQNRRLWTEDKPNINVGDVVLLKDSQVHRNEWPVGLIVNTFPSQDGKVRKVEVRVAKQGTVKTFLRPVTEIIVLLSEANTI
nr:uncharacterized protein LOC129439016 [Misgurnus anguillicaudatus]